MTMLIAALCAEGESAIQNIGQIDRGFERVDERIRSLEANHPTKGLTRLSVALELRQGMIRMR